MKTSLLALLLLCLAVPGHCDCQGDCLSCSQILPQQVSFNTMVCLVECEANVSPALSWDLCNKALRLLPFSSISMGGTMLKRSQEEALLSDDEDEQVEGGLLPSVALQRFDHATRALGLKEPDLSVRGRQLSTTYNTQDSLSMEEEQEAEEEAAQEEGSDDVTAARGPDEVGLSVSKRFGGFLKGRHGYKKLISPGRSYQKRYGGFIGVRKSARKWNNQKRFSEFLKQYLGMSTRSTEYNSVSADLTQQNEV